VASLDGALLWGTLKREHIGTRKGTSPFRVFVVLAGLVSGLQATFVGY
jgi:hypothetical protein